VLLSWKNERDPSEETSCTDGLHKRVTEDPNTRARKITAGKISTHSCSWRRKIGWQERDRANRKQKSEPASTARATRTQIGNKKTKPGREDHQHGERTERTTNFKTSRTKLKIAQSKAHRSDPEKYTKKRVVQARYTN
jgi:hypothetical protein